MVAITQNEFYIIIAAIVVVGLISCTYAMETSSRSTDKC